MEKSIRINLIICEISHMFNWIKNFYKKDISIAITLVLVFIVYWFVSTAIKFDIATPFVWSKKIYDEVFSIAIVFLIFRIIFIKTKLFQQKIFSKRNFAWDLVKIIWIVSILYVWSVISTEMPKITTKAIYSASNLPMYVIDPCSYYNSDDLFDNKNRKWTDAEEKEALEYWRLPNVSWSFQKKCMAHENDRSDNVF
jgi:hypothetical protein